MAWNEYIKTGKGGRQYRYAQRSVRVPGRRTPKTLSVYLGPVGGYKRRRGVVKTLLGLPDADWQATFFGTPEDRAANIAERYATKVEQGQREKFGGTPDELREREQKAFETKMHLDYGMKVGTGDPVASEPASQSPDDGEK